MRVSLSTAARTDLRDIGDWIARDSRRRAASYVDELLGRCRDLERDPRRNPEVLTLRSRAVRRAIHGNYLLFYEIDDAKNEVVVLRILHGARDHEAILTQGADSGESR